MIMMMLIMVLIVDVIFSDYNNLLVQNRQTMLLDKYSNN